jgi:simple sugar transport system ATP-binding protein
MVGAEIAAVRPPDPVPEGAMARLALSGLSLPKPHPFAVDLKSVSLEVRAGEILGIAGIAGNGQDELFDALSGERLAQADVDVRINGSACGRLGITARRRLGAAFVPEERLGHGAVPRMRLSSNVVLTRYATGDGLAPAGVIDHRAASRISARVSEDYDVRKGTPDPEASALSGGNLQKFVVGREIDRRPTVLVVSQPTWGVDAGAATTIRQALVDLARGGSAVLMISQDLDEILEISDRVAVIALGRLSTPRLASEMPREAIGLMMAGMGMVAPERPHAD